MSSSTGKTRDDIQSNVEDLKGVVAKIASDVTEEIEDRWDNVGKQARGYAKEANKEFARYKKSAVQQFTKQPVSSGLTILAIGFVLGCLWRRD